MELRKPLFHLFYMGACLAENVGDFSAEEDNNRMLAIILY
jgi:hypothetical protein